MLTEDEVKKFDNLLNKIYEIQDKENISDEDYDLYLEYSREINPLMDKAPGEIQKQFIWTNEAFFLKAKRFS